LACPLSKNELFFMGKGVAGLFLAAAAAADYLPRAGK
jgi:hypothetical protein